MHLITQSCVLFLWMHSLTFVKGRECTLEQFLNSPQYNQNFDTSGLAATYSGGRQVRVGCNVGFSGFFKLICVEGKWDTKGTICTLKPCGHPGDSQNADFQLEKGEDFVFGSQVKYTCHKGYQMVSRTNYRRCMAEGWDGNIPVCEAQQCPIIDVDSHVQVNGDIEEATFGNVVRFSCKSSSKVLFGSAEMYCDENGEWVGESPKCKEIICTAPEIEHGEVLGQTQEYKEDQFLEFQCDHLFTSVGARSSKCTKQGVRAEWSPTPLCEPCSNVKVQHGFVVGPYNDTLYYTCEEGYKLPTKGWWAEAKCNDSVSSELKTCIENTTCGDLPVILNGKVTVALTGESAQVNCTEGYSTEVSHFSCLDGVPLKIICKPEANPCIPPDKVQNAVVMTAYQKEYLSDSEVTYKCRKSYTAKGETTIRCIDGQWGETNIMCTCSDAASPADRSKEECTSHNRLEDLQHLAAHVEGSQLPQKIESAHPLLVHSTLSLLLKMQLSLILLLLQLWGNVEVTLSQNACPNVPHIPHAHVVDKTEKAEYQGGNVIHFACETGYISGPTIKYVCTNEGWHVLRAGSCYLKPCELPDDTPNGFYQITHGEELVFGTKIKYFCNEGYQMVSKDDTRTCFLDNWTNHLPICEQPKSNN
ncbi:complement factor H-like [Notothenia coriiceps]|uniref:Complement factor H-like n=1 Tax=Notothenia coriiceps TaxID=8208 RepID=A0A6I9PWH1_9TELE|nr:PREDICTED: complement factor H-like [Notothenia coriiceps]